ncbi:hypothetical protein GCM10027418_07250 [Mariniluteicoccus endophyticus]
MKTATTVILSIAACAALTGCSGIGATPSSSVPTGVNRPAATSTAPVELPSSAPATSATPTPTPTNSGIQEFGQAYAYSDGLTVTVGQPKAYKPSDTAAGADRFPNAVVFDVTVVNKSQKAWDPVLFHATLQSANEEASRIYDSGKLPADPSTKVLPGREVKFKMAFAVADTGDLVMQVQPDFEHDDVLFQKK